MQTGCLSKVTLNKFVIFLENRGCKLKLACQTTYTFWEKDNDDELEPKKIYFFKVTREPNEAIKANPRMCVFSVLSH